MSMRTGNATRDRILMARDEFRASLNDQQKQEPQQNVPPQQAAQPQQQVQQNVPPQQSVPPQQQVQQNVPPQQDVKSVPPEQMNITDDFINSVNSLGVAGIPPAPARSETTDNPELKAMREENARLLKEVEELRKAHETDSASIAELNQLREKKRVDEYLASLDGGLGSINGEDARKLVGPLLQQMDTAKKESQRQLQEAREAIDKRFSEYDKKTAINKSNQLYAKIMKAHPDLQQLQSTPAYAQVMLSPVQEGSLITVGEVVAAEIKKGNADYVIKVLDSVKARNGTPNINDVASVSSTSAASGSVTGHDVSGDKLTYEQIADLRLKVQTGEMSRDEFRQIMARHREASKLH